MFARTITIDDSKIHGRGVFAIDNIPAGKLIWKFADGHDIAMPSGEFEILPQDIKTKISRTGFYSTINERWIFPPNGDAAQFLNHSGQPNLSAIYDMAASDEVYFVTNKLIRKGQELTTNYGQYDKAFQVARPEWAR